MNFSEWVDQIFPNSIPTSSLYRNLLHYLWEKNAYPREKHAKAKYEIVLFSSLQITRLGDQSQAPSIDKVDINKNWNSAHGLARFLWKKPNMLPDSNIKDNKMSLCSQHNCSGTGAYTPPSVACKHSRPLQFDREED